MTTDLILYQCVMNDSNHTRSRFIQEAFMSASFAAVAELARVTRRLAQFREDYARGIVSAQLVRQYELLVSYAERDVQDGM